MTVFAIIAPSPNEELEKAVKSTYPDRWYEIAPGQFLISAERTTVTQVMNKLGVSGGSKGRAMIMRLGSYSGWHVKDLWEWIEAQTSPPATPTPDVSSDGDE